MRERLLNLIPQLAGRRVLIVGDVILDEYLTGRATRMSREAPIPVLEFESRRHVAGGAGNPAANVVALGSEALLAAVVGVDAEADALRHVLRQNGIAPDALIVDETRPTTLKTRLMAHMGLRFPQQVARLDRLSRAALSPEVEKRVGERIAAVLPQADAVLVSDYRSGMLSPPLVRLIRDLAADKLTTVDSQGEFDKYAGFSVVKCNADEARDHLRRDLRSDADFAEGARLLFDRMALKRAMVITRGSDGATVALPDGVFHCPAPVITDVFDTVGAGDTAIAVMTLVLIAGAAPVEAVALANAASGVVVRRVGNYAPTPQDLQQAVAASAL
ncbi:MAG: bifunctional ADP-heptose synthase [Anaerolineae bacterium]|nr:bifunctional ADP-heptose synthase [Anaerolineae bacterium]NUQ05716.1 ribokinase [Anaerolineae bacterium]